MDEPSVLDFVKAKIAFWKKADVSIPVPEGETTDSAAVLSTKVSPSAGVVRLPWLVFLPFALAIVAQITLEPPDQRGLIGGLIYSIAAIATAGVYLSGRIQISQAPEDENRIDDMQMNWRYAVAGFIALMASFILFGSHSFSAVNLLVWGFSLVVFVTAFIQTTDWPSWTARVTRVQAWSRQPVLRIPLSTWMLALVLVCGVIAFFRFYDLGHLPFNMVSDHAEKLYDGQDILDGQAKVFFERNTGREAFQFYWTALMVKLFGTGISFMSLKLGTVLVGIITLYFIFRLGDELGGRWVGLYALLFAGVAYWSNIISRIGLRFPLYPFCVAPVMFYLIRGLRTNQRNDFIWAGLWLGIGLHGYTASRVVPGLVIAAILLYVIHRQSHGRRMQALVWGALLLFISFAVFLPLFRFAIDYPELFNSRIFSRIADTEQALPGDALGIFISNTWNALRMFFLHNGEVWVHSIPYRPALDIVSAALFFVGAVLLLVRYVKTKHWRDAFLLISIPILLLPSILSLAFPNENPSLNRTAGAYVPVFLIAAIGFDALLSSIRSRVEGSAGYRGAVLIGVLLIVVIIYSNYQLFFVQYRAQYNQNAWNTTELGEVMNGFVKSGGSADTAYVVGYPYWVDTRLVGINAGFPRINPEINIGMLAATADDPRSKVFMINTNDVVALTTLRELFPMGKSVMHSAPNPEQNFILFNVPAQVDFLP